MTTSAPLPRFPRGFLISSGGPGPEPPARFRRELQDWHWFELAGLHLAVAPEVPVQIHEGETTLALIGDALDPIAGLTSPGEVAGSLAEAAAECRDALLERLDDLTGRFVLLALGSERRELFHDAGGARSVFHAWSPETGAMASSHLALTAALSGAPPDEGWRRSLEGNQSETVYLPGLMTPSPGVRLLTPNTCLQLETGAVERFWPRRPAPPTRKLTAVAAEAAGLLRTQAELLATGRRLSLSLTGGLDSRITLASLRPHLAGVAVFTLSEGPGTEAGELEAAARLCQHLGVAHLAIANQFPAARRRELQTQLRESSGGLRERSCFGLALATPELASRTHLGSGVSETGRAHYRTLWARRPDRGPLPERPDDRLLARLFGDWVSNPWAIEAFGEFRRTVVFDRVIELGYDPYDLFYWEHRAGCWYALTLQESDAACDSLAPFANRRLLDLMLSAPLPARLDDSLHRGILRDLWPEALEIPFLPKVRRPRRVGRRLRSLVRWLTQLRSSSTRP